MGERTATSRDENNVIHSRSWCISGCTDVAAADDSHQVYRPRSRNGVDVPIE